MPTFAKKAEVVDARQFTGSLKNAKELVAWVTANGGEASWGYSQEVRHDGNKVISEVTKNVMSVYTDVLHRGVSTMENQFINPETWIVLKQDGKFDVKTHEQLQAEYEVV